MLMSPAVQPKAVGNVMRHAAGKPSPGRTPQSPARKKTCFTTPPPTTARDARAFLNWHFQPWQMLASLMAERRDHARLSNLDDHMLKDIGLTRGSIRSAIRNGRSGQ